MPFSNFAKLHPAISSFMTYWFNILRSLLLGRFTRLDSIEYQKKLNFRVMYNCVIKHLVENGIVILTRTQRELSTLD